MWTEHVSWNQDDKNSLNELPGWFFSSWFFVFLNGFVKVFLSSESFLYSSQSPVARIFSLMFTHFFRDWEDNQSEVSYDFLNHSFSSLFLLLMTMMVSLIVFQMERESHDVICGDKKVMEPEILQINELKCFTSRNVREWSYGWSNL